LSEALSGEFLADSPLAMQRYRGVPFIVWVRMRMDMATYHWARLVLGYDSKRQFAFLENTLGAVSRTRVVLFLLGCGGLALLITAWNLFRLPRKQRRDPATQAYLTLCDRLAAIGVARRVGEGPQHYAQRVSSALPHLAGEVQAITRDTIALCYARDADAPIRALRQMRQLRDRVRKFRATPQPR
jgi:protein-glutamine gamma-glutamyltransferase